MSHYLLFLSWFNQLFNNLFFTYYPKFLTLADMINAASLAAAPQLVRDDAPVSCPAAVTALLAKCSKFEAQSRKTDIEWDDSREDISSGSRFSCSPHPFRVHSQNDQP
jgi:hypothetical protein